MTTDLQSLLSAKRADLTKPEPMIDFVPSNEEAKVEVVQVTEHGEIVQHGRPEFGPPPIQVVEHEPTYPSIPPKVVGGLPYVRDYMKLARTIHSTEMVPQAFQGRPDAILATFLRGYEMGFGPMQALDSFNVIEGKVGLTAEAMRALIMDNGHQIILEDVISDSLLGIQAKCHRKDWPADMWVTYGFTMEDAKVAGLLAPSRSGKPTAWQKYPRAMMDARATAGAARRYFPDVLAGMSYTPEEIRDFSGDDREEQPSSPSSPVSGSFKTSPPTPTAATPDAPASTSEASDPISTVPTTPSAPTTEPEPTPLEPKSSTPSPPISSPPKAAHAKKATADDVPTSSAPAEVSPSTPPTAPVTSNGSDVRLEMRKGLTAVIAGLEPLQQPLVRAFLAQQGYGDITKLTEAGIQEAINIAAGWPDTAVVDAEVVDDGQLALDADF